MPATWAAFLNDPNGNRLADLNDLESFGLARIESGVGALTMTLPYNAVPYSYWKRDGIISLERTPPDGGTPSLFTEQAYFITKRRRYYDDNGAARVQITAQDANCLLYRRWVLYAAGTANASLSAAAAGNQMRSIVTANLGSGAGSAGIGAGRVISTLTVGANLGDGASIAKDFSWRRVLPVLQELAQSSITAGSYLAFDLVCTTPPGAGTLGLEFRTYAGQRGLDHRYPSGTAGPVLLGPDFGTLANADYVEDFSDEQNYVVALGQGNGTARDTSAASDSTRYGSSPYALCEGAVQATNTYNGTTTSLAAEANAGLRAGLPTRLFSATIVDTAGVRFGVEYGFGDYLTAQAFGESFDCRLSAVRVSYGRDGERITAVLKNDASLYV